MNAADILIGTSGWVFDDWAGYSIGIQCSAYASGVASAAVIFKSA